MNITAIVEDFTNQIVAAVERSAHERVQAAIAATFGDGAGAPGVRRGISVFATTPLAERPGRSPVSGSAKQLRARQLQGQYLGALRALTDADKSKVKNVAKEKGVAAALTLAKTLRKAA